LVNWAAVTELELQLIDPDSPAIKALETAVEQAIKVATKSAAELSELRKSAAVQLAEHVSVELKSLALPHAIFDVDIQPADLSDVGADKVEFRFSANPGLSLAPIANAASGGELSRLMLALEVALVEKSEGFGPSVMLFDEVDAGVAGQAAISVAERLAKLARHRQVLVVSHLPQLAAYADLHITVSKDSNGMVTESFIKGLDETDRSSELARMLAGVAESSSALEHAAELLEMAQSWKRSLND
jgi:DNA repair protein RecN (Recombination protein N)